MQASIYTGLWKNREYRHPQTTMCLWNHCKSNISFTDCYFSFPTAVSPIFRRQTNCMFISKDQTMPEVRIKAWIGADLNRRLLRSCHNLVHSTHWATVSTRKGFEPLTTHVNLTFMLSLTWWNIYDIPDSTLPAPPGRKYLPIPAHNKLFPYFVTIQPPL